MRVGAGVSVAAGDGLSVGTEVAVGGLDVAVGGGGLVAAGWQLVASRTNRTSTRKILMNAIFLFPLSI